MQFLTNELARVKPGSLLLHASAHTFHLPGEPSTSLSFPNTDSQTAGACAPSPGVQSVCCPLLRHIGPIPLTGGSPSLRALCAQLSIIR
jgi:hypothetical protein